MSEIKSLSNQVYDYIIRQIRLGKLTGGDKIIESSLAEKLHTRRTPVHDALIALTEDGILENGKKRGFVVRIIEREELLQKSIIIAQLDAFIAELAFPNITEIELSQMEDFINRMDLAIKQRDFGFYYDAQESFHDVYFKVCGNPYLLEIINSLQTSLVRTSVLSNNNDALFKQLLKYNDDHKKIVDYFREGNLDALKSTIITHRYDPDDSETLY